MLRHTLPGCITNLMPRHPRVRNLGHVTPPSSPLPHIRNLIPSTNPPRAHSGTLTTLQNNVPKAQHYPNLAPETYKAFYTQFAAALRGEADVPVRPEEAREVIRIIELARRSSVEGKTLDV